MDCDHDLTRLEASKMLISAAHGLGIDDKTRTGRPHSDRAWLARLEALSTMPFGQFAEACVAYLDILDAAKGRKWGTSVPAASAALRVPEVVVEFALRMTGAEWLGARGIYLYGAGAGTEVELFPKPKATA